MRIARRTRADSRSGVALVISLVVLAVLMTVTTAFFILATGKAKRVSGGFDDDRTLLLAESGLHEAYEALRNGGTGAIGSPDDPAYLGGGVFWVSATPQGPDEVLLVSTAMIGSGRKAVGALASFDPNDSPLFQTTLNSRERLTLNQGVMIDSFDSAAGTYIDQMVNLTNGHQHASMNGDARSNEDVVLNSQATVFGDAIPGPGHLVTYAFGSFVSGSDTPAPEPFQFPELDLPGHALAGALTVPNLGSASIGPGDFELATVSIGKSAVLSVKGPATILLDDFSGGRDARLVVDATAGPVTFNVRGNYTHLAGFQASAAPGSPLAVAFMLEGKQDVVFPSNTAIRGAYYAPNANIVFSNANECWGAFAANRIDMSNDMKFHFDEDLMNHWEADTGDLGDAFKVLAWQVVEFEPDELLGDRRDPLAILGVTKSDLAKPVDLWVPAP